MELTHLRYFVALAEELHRHRATKHLHLAPPAVTDHVRELEAELGVSLFTRTHGSVALTDAGAAMLEDARRALRQADIAQYAARQAHERDIGQLRLGYLADALPAAVPRMLHDFTTEEPRIQPVLETGGASRLIGEVREERLDVAVVCLPAPVTGLRVVPLGEEGTVAAVPEVHPCAREPRISLQALLSTPLVQLPRSVNPAFHDSVMSACSKAGVAPVQIPVGEPDVEQALLAVVSGAGIALLPESAATRYSMPGVRFRPVAPPAPACEVALVARAEAGAATTAFLRLAGRATRPRLRLVVAG